jgi:hypothetical protein
MQNPSDHQAEVSIPAETVRDGPNLNRRWTRTTVHAMRRKAAKRSESWYQDTVAPLFTPARKKQRLDEPLLPPPLTTDEAASKAASLDSSVGLPPPPTVTSDDDDSNADPVTDTPSNAGATGYWTSDEDALLTSAFTKTCKRKWRKAYVRDWNAVAALVPGRTRQQCWNRWKYVLDPNIDITNGRKASWSEDEDSKLKGALQTHGGKNWGAIAALMSGRAEKQCWTRWHDVMHHSSCAVGGRTASWTEGEAVKLTRAVQRCGDKDWVAVAALVPGRTKKQCQGR